MLELADLSLTPSVSQPGWRQPRNLFALALIVVGVMTMATSLTLLVANNNRGDLAPCLTSVHAEVTPALVQSLYIDVRGEVVSPGLYQLEAGARIGDAINLAGGLTKRADGCYSQYQLNLAQKLTDGEKIYVPMVGEFECLREKRGASEPPTQVEVSDLGLVSINQATLNELKALPGIGDKRAMDIIDGRPYTNLSDLIDQKIISESLYEKIIELISL